TGRQIALPSRSRMTRASFADFLPELEAVAEREHSPVARFLIIAVAALFAMLLLWSALAEVNQLATAPGQVRPIGKVKVINHPEGGTVAGLFMKEGDVVKADQVLIELSPDLIREEMGKAENEWQSLSAEVARLTGEAKGETPDFPTDLGAARPDLIANETRLYEARRNSMESRQSTAQEQINQRLGDIAGLREQIRALEVGLEVLVEQEAAIATLAGKGYFPKLRYLSIKRQVAEAKGQLGQVRQQLRSTEAALLEASSRRDSVGRDMLSEVLGRLAQARIERDRAFRTLQQQRSRLANLVIRSPVDGIVQNLEIAAVGQAIPPGDPIMNIVPTGDTLIVEAQVSNADIGFIYIGQEAKVKITTYDYVKFGELQGRVEQISPNSVQDPETKQSTFPVQIRVNQTYMGDFPGKFPVTPGMEAQVDMVIGERSILSYLTDRVARTTSEAFTER
ncbi:MAG: HlyD family type I secretion periplasmic adaptor subunit, partial [Rhodospirillaceae bacterium]|nr:HlyD family type I secretion periplasmic adaptor subunit [Rhodospirillaceae bacterium]